MYTKQKKVKHNQLIITIKGNIFENRYFYKLLHIITKIPFFILRRYNILFINIHMLILHVMVRYT